MIGFKQTVQAIYIESAANEGVKMLLDIRKICDASALQKTFSHTARYNDFESYVVFGDGFSIVGVFITATVSCRLWQAESYESNHIHLFAGGVKHAGPRCLLPGRQAPQHHAHLAQVALLKSFCKCRFPHKFVSLLF